MSVTPTAAVTPTRISGRTTSCLGPSTIAIDTVKIDPTLDGTLHKTYGSDPTPGTTNSAQQDYLGVNEPVDERL